MLPAFSFDSADTPEAIARDVAAVQRISAVPALLRVLCNVTGMGFTAVARVTEGTWTACAVQDNIGFGLMPGGQLELSSTLCTEARQARQAIVIDHASQDPVYCDHHTPRLYNIESYVSVPIVLADGSYFGNLCAIDPHPRTVSDAGTVAMFTAYASLIAAQLENEAHQQETEDALLQSEERAELREQFVAILGHDLRNPLSSIVANAEVLIRRTQEPHTRDTGLRVRASARRMARLIDTVLDFAQTRLGSGIGIDKTETATLGAALGEVIAEIREANPEREIAETVAIEGPVFCDSERIQQLLSNLLGNAIHHGAPDRPVHVQAWTSEGWLLLEVANEGTPIPPEELRKIFEPYWRSPSSTPRKAGLGLGLHICTQIAKGHGGTLSATSSAEDGTRFTAVLPRAPVV